MANKNNPKIRDIKPAKDAKGGGGGQWSGSKQQGHTPPTHGAQGGIHHGPSHEHGGGGPRGGI